ncbi:MAG: glycine cleavage T C-terminal barrel domain-containing protein [Byssovorax sp.]
MSTIDPQRRAAQEGALLHPRPDLGALLVTGKDRQTWLNGLITNNLATSKAGDGIYALTVGKTGKILAELWLVLSSDRVALALAADKLEAIREHFDRHLIMEDAEVAPAPGRGWIAVHGPLAAELVAFARGKGADAAMVDFTGRRDTAAILAPEGEAEPFLKALLDHAGERGALATEEGMERLRIDWGVPRFGVDFDDQSLPQEASLERLSVSFTKGCYLGQEAVFMLEKRGHARKRLMRVAIEGSEPVPAGAELTLADGTALGVLTSQAEGPSGQRVGLGYVKYKHAEAGVEVTVGGRPARLVGLAAEPLKATAP